MKLTIIAATGGVGRELLEQAVAAGHDVTAVVRNPGKLSRKVRAITADLAAPDPAALESAVAGADAVLSGLGPHSNSNAGIASQGTPAIVAAMKGRRRAPHRRGQRRAGQHRAHAPAAPARPNTTRETDSSCGTYSATSQTRGSARSSPTSRRWKTSFAESGLDWTVIRPPQLTGKPLTGTYRTAYRAEPQRRPVRPPRGCRPPHARRARPARHDPPGHRNRQLAPCAEAWRDLRGVARPRRSDRPGPDVNAEGNRS